MDLLARFVGILVVFVMYIAVSVEGVAYDAACKNDADCNEAKNVCTTSKCACSTDSYRKGGKECATKIALAGACTATPTGQCADSNAQCDGTPKTCICKSAHFVNKIGACRPRKKPNESCAAKQCVTHATCNTTDTNTCVCDKGYTASPTTSPTMCSGVVIFAALSYMYVVPIVVSMMCLLR